MPEDFKVSRQDVARVVQRLRAHGCDTADDVERVLLTPFPSREPGEDEEEPEPAQADETETTTLSEVLKELANAGRTRSVADVLKERDATRRRRGAIAAVRVPVRRQDCG